MGKPGTLRFGAFALDRGQRLLLRDGATVHLSPRALRLLLSLLARAPDAVSKGELHEAIWPDAFVSEGTLTGLAAELRAALGDDARNPTLIRTVHGFGYAFTGEISTDARPPAATRFRVTVLGREVALQEGENLIGRAADTTIFIDDASVSRIHASIHVSIHVDGEATLHDLGSKNGTFLNGERLTEPRVLHHRDTIAAGVVAMTFQDTRTNDSTMTMQVG
jgi:DNA-binding winged helix-turn-helix (wHTH) protein